MNGACEMITDFSQKKLAEYLEPGQKVLIRFGHGWGDTLMFMPILERLRRLYPETQIDLYLECGQEEIFKSYPEKDSQSHDVVFSLDFPMSEGSGITKAEKCCQDEIGISHEEQFAILPDKGSPFVAVHFHGTALPDSVGCPEDKARIIWQDIIDAGKIPIECHFEHIFHNPINAKFGFVDNNVRKCQANLHSLIGLIQHSFAFIGVASGCFVTALNVNPERTMLLERNHKLTDYTRDSRPQSLSMNAIESGMVKKWLGGLR